MRCIVVPMYNEPDSGAALLDALTAVPRASGPRTWCATSLLEGDALQTSSSGYALKVENTWRVDELRGRPGIVPASVASSRLETGLPR